MIKTQTELLLGDVIVGTGQVAFWIITTINKSGSKCAAPLMLNDKGKPCRDNHGITGVYFGREGTGFDVVFNLCNAEHTLIDHAEVESAMFQTNNQPHNIKTGTSY